MNQNQTIGGRLIAWYVCMYVFYMHTCESKACYETKVGPLVCMCVCVCVRVWIGMNQNKTAVGRLSDWLVCMNA
jgi:hypothetical protein